VGDTECCRVQLFDLLSAWDKADNAERTELVGGLFERIEAQAEPGGGARWSPFGGRAGTALQRHAGDVALLLRRLTLCRRLSGAPA
jgi:hypothetical protein